MKNNNARVKIKFSEGLYLRMKVLNQHGDLREIADATGEDYQRIRRVWEQRKGEKKLVDAFIKFYEAREKYLKSSEVKEMAV